jgi:hypothetical protein
MTCAILTVYSAEQMATKDQRSVPELNVNPDVNAVLPMGVRRTITREVEDSDDDLLQVSAVRGIDGVGGTA